MIDIEAIERQTNQLVASAEFESIETAELSFNEGVEASILGDESAMSIVKDSMKYMYENGEIQRLQSMAMQIGAMACMHDHMQELSTQTTEMFGDPLKQNDPHESSHDHDDHEDDDKKGKKKKKRRGWPGIYR